MKKQARFNYANAYNAQQGLLGNRVKLFAPNETVITDLAPLKEWCETNLYSIREARRLLMMQYLYGLKLKGRWYVRLNPMCTLKDLPR